MSNFVEKMIPAGAVQMNDMFGELCDGEFVCYGSVTGKHKFRDEDNDPCVTLEVNSNAWSVTRRSDKKIPVWRVAQ